MTEQPGFSLVLILNIGIDLFEFGISTVQCQCTTVNSPAVGKATLIQIRTGALQPGKYRDRHGKN